MNYQLGIIGGVGSEASAYLYNRILKSTQAPIDQEHLNMVILNHAEIADRTSYILDHTKDNPLPYFLEDITLLNQIGVKLILIPCNTSHYFYDEFQRVSEVPIYHLIHQTTIRLKKEGVKKVAILATDGTIQSGLYQQSCDAQGLEWVIPSSENQKNVMSLIYDDIKAGKPIHHDKLNAIVKEMDGQNVERLILGCTELSILKEKENLDERFIDPLEVAIDYVLDYFGKTKFAK